MGYTGISDCNVSSLGR